MEASHAFLHAAADNCERNARFHLETYQNHKPVSHLLHKAQRSFLGSEAALLVFFYFFDCYHNVYFNGCCDIC